MSERSFAVVGLDEISDVESTARAEAVVRWLLDTGVAMPSPREIRELTGELVAGPGWAAVAVIPEEPESPQYVHGWQV